MGAVEHLKTLCCLGLKPESAMVAVTPLLHEIIPHGWTRMAFIEPDATLSRGYTENPAMALHLERFLELLHDPANIIGSIYLPNFKAVGIGWALHRQGRGWLDSDWYQEVEAPADSCWWLEAMIGDGARTIASVHLTRPRSARPFTTDDVQKLDPLRPWLAHAFRRSLPESGPQDLLRASVTGRPVLSGQMVLTADAKVIYQTRDTQLLLTYIDQKTIEARYRSSDPRQAARAGSEASPADHRRRERHLQRAAAHADSDRLWRSHARCQMARAGGHASGRSRQGFEKLSDRGDDGTPRTPHCPCGARAAGMRRHAGAGESRHSPRSWKDATCDRGRARHPTFLGRGSHEKALSDSRCSQFRRARHENLARPKT
jgi:hypothetical protein